MTQPNLLTVGEAALRDEYESRIHAALAAIRTAHLYRESHETFSDYLKALVERLDEKGS